MSAGLKIGRAVALGFAGAFAADGWHSYVVAIGLTIAANLGDAAASEESERQRREWAAHLATRLRGVR